LQIPFLTLKAALKFKWEPLFALSYESKEEIDDCRNFRAAKQNCWNITQAHGLKFARPASARLRHSL
jgi:hypothetical protein